MNCDTINTIIAGLSGIVGIIIGASISTLVSWKLKNKEAHLRILEKTYDKRLQAHECMLQVVGLLRTTVSTKETDSKNIIISFPAALTDHDRFSNYMFEFYKLTNPNYHWFDEDLVKEINLVQDFNISIEKTIKDIAVEKIEDFGKIVKPDFIFIANRLETEILKFFTKDLNNIQIKTSIKTNRYSNQETEGILNSLELIKKSSQINALKK